MINNKKSILQIDVSQNYGYLLNIMENDDINLELEIIKNSIPFSVEGQKIILAAKAKNCNYPIEQAENISAKGNLVKIKLRDSVVKQEGEVKLQLIFEDAIGAITSSSFFIKVGKSILGDKSIKESGYITILDTTKREEPIRISNENTRKTNESTRQANELTRLSNEETRQANENIRIEQENARELIRSEIIGARGQSDNLLQELNYREAKMLENMDYKYLDFVGVGAVSVENSVNGHIQDLKILGNTTGGYDEISATSAPIVSSGMAEGGVVKVKSIGVNMLNLKEISTSKPVPDGSVKLENNNIIINGDLPSYLNIDLGGIKKKFKSTDDLFINSVVEGALVDNHFYSLWGFKNGIKVDRVSIYTYNSTLKIAWLDAVDTLDYDEVRIFLTTTWNTPATVNATIKNIIVSTIIATDYEPYQESIVEIQLPESMRATGLQKDDFVRAGANGFVEIVQNKTIYNISNFDRYQVMNSGLSDGYSNYQILNFDEIKKFPSTSRNGIADKCSYALPWGNAEATKVCIGIMRNNENLLLRGTFENINKGVQLTAEEIKIKIKELNVSICYELETPIIHQTNIQNSQLNLTTFQNLTHTLSENSVPCGLEFKAPVDVPKFIAAMKRESINQKQETGKLREGTLLLVNTFISILSPMILPTEIKENILLDNLINYKNTLI